MAGEKEDGSLFLVLSLSSGFDSSCCDARSSESILLNQSSSKGVVCGMRLIGDGRLGAISRVSFELGLDDAELATTIVVVGVASSVSALESNGGEDVPTPSVVCDRILWR